MPRRRNTSNVETEEAKRRRLAENQRRHRAQLSNQRIEQIRLLDAAAHRGSPVNNEQRRALRPVGRLINNRRSRNTALLPNNFDENNIHENNLGPMSEKCRYCKALYFKNENMNSCCERGLVILDPVRIHPEIQSYLDGSNEHSQNFRKNVRSYNSAMAFASMGAKLDDSLTNKGPFCYRIHGQTYHRMGSLHPQEGIKPSYAQLYILDSSEATDARMGNAANSKCIRSVMESLQNLLEDVNPFAALYKNMLAFEEAEKLKGNPAVNVQMIFLGDKTIHPGRINAPSVVNGDIAAIFQNSDGEPPSNRDIMVHSKTGNLQNISILNKHCDPMCYPLLFPYGDPGFTLYMKKSSRPNQNLENSNSDSEQEVEDGSPRDITPLQWYSYHFAMREGFSQFLNSGKLSHQYMVDAYCKSEANRLSYIRQFQDKLRAEDYDVLSKYVENNPQAHVPIGKKVILPSSFHGSPRNMAQNYQDAMAMVKKYGKPDLFITFTCNPKWKEIKENLLPGEQPCDRPDLIARVFRLKLKLLLKDLKEKHIFGRVIAMLHVIEFQKRGLPHAHILLILVPEDKAWEKERVDKIVCAELPNKETHPRLFEVIKTCMIHGPCGQLNQNSPCMENGKCKKEFPKDFCAETNCNVNGYPKYERKDDGNFIEIAGNKVDNRWIVPYNPFLSLKYNAHINVEICTSINSVKYLFKYVYKGHDCANIKFSNVNNEDNSPFAWDEIKWYVDGRYVSAPEGCWRLRKYEMHKQTHHIERLNVHLEDKQSLCFEPGQEARAVEEKREKSKLLAWFRLNQKDLSARKYLYLQIPEYYTWNGKNAEWKPRKRGKDTTIGRMYTVSPTDREKYFLRLLLLHVPGAKNFQDLRKVEGFAHVFETYQEACVARGLLDDDKEWDICLTEAEVMQMPIQLRQLFAFICVMCEPSDPLALFEKHKLAMLEDYVRKYPTGDTALNMALCEIQSVLSSHQKNLQDFNLPSIPRSFFENHEPVLADDVFDPEEEKLKYEEKYAMLNPEQKSAFDEIVNAIECPELQQRAFFIDGPGGSGKTFLYNTLMHYIRGKNKIVYPCAFTGIAATLLTGKIFSKSSLIFFNLKFIINK